MPLLKITTNAQIDDADSLCLQFSATVSQMLGKPESYVMVILQAEHNMSFSGSNVPCAYLELKSLGLPEDESAGFSNTLCEKTSELLGIDSSRTYIEFSNPARHMWGWNKSTF